MAAVVATPPRPRLGDGGPPSGRYQTPPRQAHGGGGFGRGCTVKLADGVYTVRLPGVQDADSSPYSSSTTYSSSPYSSPYSSPSTDAGRPHWGTYADAGRPHWGTDRRQLHARQPGTDRLRAPTPATDSGHPATPGTYADSRSTDRPAPGTHAGHRAVPPQAVDAHDGNRANWAATDAGRDVFPPMTRTGGKRARSGRVDRREVRVLVIGTGYGRHVNPAQFGMLTNAGFQVNIVDGLPNPEESHHSTSSGLEQIKAKIDQFAPHVVTAASKGGPYLVRLWETGMWRGPSVLINMHPSCRQLPRDCPIVICQGEEDECYRVSREAAEALMATGSPEKTLLYWVSSSGRLPQGVRSRHGDTHNMKSLVQNDTLPRLVDAVLDPDGPEMHLVRSWRERLSEGRLQAEARIGYTPEALQRRWQSRGQRGLEDQKLWDVQRNSDEYRCVEEMVRAAPTERAAYNIGPHGAWTRPIVAIQRIENGPQVHGCAVPYYDSLRMDIEAQGLNFEPGVHTVWTFHGTDSAAIDSIVNDSVGLRPNFAGSNGAMLWGRGTYLARDAKYVGEAGFCGRPAADGTYRMLACLTFVGMPCAADRRHAGVLPYRCKHHRYHSSVDHLSSPEVFVTVEAGAVLPAYVVTFR